LAGAFLAGGLTLWFAAAVSGEFRISLRWLPGPQVHLPPRGEMQVAQTVAGELKRAIKLRLALSAIWGPVAVSRRILSWTLVSAKYLGSYGFNHGNRISQITSPPEKDESPVSYAADDSPKIL